MGITTSIGISLALTVLLTGCGGDGMGGGSDDFTFAEDWTVGRGFVKQIAVAPGGRVWAVDQNDSKVSAYDSAGMREVLVTRYRSGRDVVRPVGIAVGSDGHVFVADGGMIFHLDAEGEHVDDWAAPMAGDPGHLEMTADDDLLVLHRETVVRSDLDGQLLDEMDTGFDSLNHIAPAADGSWFALDEPDSGGERIVHFDDSGQELGSWPLDMTGEGLAVGPAGNIYAGAWMGTPRIMGVYSTDGDLLASFSAGVDMPGYLTYVVDVAVAEDGEVYLTGIRDSEHVIVRISPRRQL